MVLYESWTASVHPVAAYNSSTMIVNLTTAFNTEWLEGASGSRGFFINMLEALDSEGEFFFDNNTNILQWIVPNGQDPNTLQVIYPQILEVCQLYHGS